MKLVNCVGIVIALCMLFIMSVSACSYMVDMQAVGLVSSSGSTTVSTCDSLSSVSTSIFGMTSVSYAQVMTSSSVDKYLSTGDGFLFVSDGMSDMQFKESTRTCGRGTCQIEPGYFNAVVAQTDALLYGPGTYMSSAQTGSNAQFGTYAVGNGMLNQHVGMLDMKQTVTDGKLNTCIDEQTMSQNMHVVGKFDFKSHFARNM